jgi:hypothetical protein
LERRSWCQSATGLIIRSGLKWSRKLMIYLSD